ncbi:condensation domain-containing protein, partial [Mycobacterium sp. NPDC003449]
MTQSPVIDTLLPFSSAQLEVWFKEISTGVSFNIAHFIEVNSPVDYDLYDAATRGAYTDFGLDTRIVFADGLPHYREDETYGIEITRVDYLDFTGDSDPEKAALTWMGDDARRVLDLETEFPLRSAVLRVGAERYFLYGKAHHAVADGIGGIILATRLCDRYNALVEGRDPTPFEPLSLREIYQEERKYLGSDQHHRDREYWSTKVQDFPEDTSLAIRRGVPSALVHRVSREAPGETLALLMRVAEQCACSPARLAVAAFSSFLARMTDAAEVGLTLPVAARPSAGLMVSGGMLANALPIRIRLDRQTTFGDLIKNVRAEMKGAQGHQLLRYPEIAQLMDREGGVVGSFGPTVSLEFFNQEFTFGEARGNYHILCSGVIDDLQLNVHHGGGSSPLSVDFLGNANLYSEAELAMHHERFLHYLHAFLSHYADDAPVQSVPLWLAGERERLELLNCGPEVSFGSGVVDVGVLLGRVDGGSVAVVADDGVLTYG